MRTAVVLLLASFPAFAKGPVFADVVSSVSVLDATPGKTMHVTAFVDVAGYCASSSGMQWPDCMSFARGTLEYPQLSFTNGDAFITLNVPYDGRGAYEGTVALPAAQKPGSYLLTRLPGPFEPQSIVVTGATAAQPAPAPTVPEPQPARGCAAAPGLLAVLALATGIRGRRPRSP